MDITIADLLPGKLLLSLLLLLVSIGCSAKTPGFTITAVNQLAFERPNQTIEVSVDQLRSLRAKDLQNVHIKNEKGQEILCQAVDVDGDFKPDKIIFQANFDPNQSRKFYAYIGKRRLYTPDQFKAYARFVRERSDDFAWENDRIVQRTYGQALMTSTKGGPLTSSAIDVWCKSVHKLVINDWYMTDHVETDVGKGADLYRAGNSRGVGGDGLWSKDKLWVSQNYFDSRVYTNGPVRVRFKLTYDPFEVQGNSVKEIKHVTLDAGQNLNHYKIVYDTEASQKLVAGIGIENTNLTAQEVRKGIKPDQPIERSPGAFTQKDVNKKHGWMIMEQPLSEGQLYSAIIITPKDFVKVTRDAKNELLLAKVRNQQVSYWAGFVWSKSGQFKDYDAWKAYINHVAQELQSPIQVTVSHK